MLPTQDHPYPRVGVAMFVIKDGKFLMGLRQGSHSPGVWGLPGGKLDLGESWEAGAIRETQEETGLIVKNAMFT
jgi:8-oxo-dGTP diphosphatase